MCDSPQLEAIIDQQFCSSEHIRVPTMLRVEPATHEAAARYRNENLATGWVRQR